MNKVILLLFLVIYGGMNDIYAQLSTIDRKNFEAQVKTMEEFVNRYNGTEDNPSVKKDSLGRRNNIIALFDYEMSHEGKNPEEFKTDLADFIDKILKSEKIALTDSTFFAECKCNITIDGKQKKIYLILRQEKYKENRLRWSIAGVRDITSAIPKISELYPISPVEHEQQFMSIDNIFEYNRPEIFGYRSTDVKIDALTFFLTKVMDGKVKFNTVDNLQFHNLSVPGFYFIISEKASYGKNSGWLISKYGKCNKKDYINKLLGK